MRTETTHTIIQWSAATPASQLLPDGGWVGSSPGFGPASRKSGLQSRGPSQLSALRNSHTQHTRSPHTHSPHPHTLPAPPHTACAHPARVCSPCHLSLPPRHCALGQARQADSANDRMDPDCPGGSGLTPIAPAPPTQLAPPFVSPPCEFKAIPPAS